MTVAAGVVAEADADAPPRDVLAAALEANERLAQRAEELRADNARLREELARRGAELDRVNAELAVLQRLVFGRSSERVRPDAAGGGDQGRDRAGGGDGRRQPGPGAPAGRRDYSHLPRIEVIWDFEGGRYWCPQCEEPFARLGDHVVEQLDRQVVVRVVAHCRRRYRRACGCRVPATVTAPGPPKAIGRGEPAGYPGTGRGSPACRAPDNPGLLHPDQLASDHDPGAPAARAASLAEKEELLAVDPEKFFTEPALQRLPGGARPAPPPSTLRTREADHRRLALPGTPRPRRRSRPPSAVGHGQAL